MDCWNLIQKKTITARPCNSKTSLGIHVAEMGKTIWKASPPDGQYTKVLMQQL
jgi:hypothetical protein